MQSSQDAVAASPRWIFCARMMPTWRGLPDPGVLALAAAEDRILVWHDFRTMPSSPGLKAILSFGV